MSQNELLMSHERRRFEHWFSDQGKWPQAVERSGDGYRLMQANDAWRAWQAAAVTDITPAMVEAAEEAYMPFGDMYMALQAAFAHSDIPTPDESEGSE